MNEALIRSVVDEVLGRLGQSQAGLAPQKIAPPVTVGAHSSVTVKSSSGARPLGVFQDAGQACEAAAMAFKQLQQKGVAARRRIIEIIKEMCFANAKEWGRVELEETRIGRLDHKIGKLTGIRSVPGVEFIHPNGWSGDHGIMLEEYTPFGVIGAVTPSTHSIPTVACNVVSMVAGGNTVVFNPHPNAARCAAMATRAFNEAIAREVGIENVFCLIEAPTLESFKAMCSHPEVRLLCVTGGPGVVKAAMQTGKRAICAGPGNPPVVVDETADLDRAARCVIMGAAFDNNLLCIGEKEVFVVEKVADAFMKALEKNGAARLNDSQLERLSKAAFVFKEGQGAGCPHPVVNRDLVGRDAAVLAQAAGANVPSGVEMLFAETEAKHIFVDEEQMMPFVPVVRVKNVEEAIQEAKRAEHSYRHTSIIHSHDVENMTAMARALDTTIFVKNGSCLAGLGNGGEGYPSFSIATPTGEGITNPKTFTRVRRCVMVDNLRIY
ncbi:MAG: aldehyde dehydrogenase EutE [Verrucomicrobiae bacterium]|nr:aldehyde dehydrogenase EutE [Verrucomicrobiae bacterium]